MQNWSPVVDGAASPKVVAFFFVFFFHFLFDFHCLLQALRKMRDAFAPVLNQARDTQEVSFVVLFLF